ncbi:hypothetical protein [Enhygromyxa salina]|uniref:hypothetical protein n=1 Tax=Enhygromyxa salina TaxID=215803 RepID=UPI000D092A45|nr:hypothetical protein [Enhygromyxa salina]
MKGKAGWIHLEHRIDIIVVIVDRYMVIGQNMPWPDQEARTRAHRCVAEPERDFFLSLDDRSQGIRLELLRAGDRLAAISKVDRDGRRAIELSFADSNARMVLDLPDLEVRLDLCQENKQLRR